MNEFTVTFIGFNLKTEKSETRRFKVRARDTYHATDLLDAKHGLRDKYVLRNFKFNTAKKKIPALLKRVVAGAGPEEF